jgi:hypothetical protein
MHFPSLHFVSFEQQVPAPMHFPSLHFLSFEQQVLAPMHIPSLHFLSFEQHVLRKAHSLFAQRLPPAQTIPSSQFFLTVAFCLVLYGPQRLVMKVLMQLARWARGLLRQFMVH